MTMQSDIAPIYLLKTETQESGFYPQVVQK